MSNTDAAQTGDFSPRRDLYQIFGSAALSKRQKIKVIGNLDEVYGYDLVFIIYLILETGLSGYLNVVNQKNEISGIVFSNGKIVKIDLPDRDTLFGQLLIQEGYVTLEALNKLIQSNSSSLGEQLISNKIISKEQFIELLLKQMRLRLSKYISQLMYRINFVESDEGSTLFSIDQNQYLSLAHDWIAGRFESKWLTMHYVEFLNSQVVIREGELSASTVKELPLAKIFYDKKQVITESKNLEILLNALKATNEADLFMKSLHFLIIAGYAQFVETQQQAEDKSKSFIQKIYSNMIKKSEVEMLESVASILKVKPTDIDGIYNEINRAIERSSEDADEDIKIELSRLSLDILSKKKHFLYEYNKVYSKQAASEEVDKQLVEQIKLDLLQKNFYAAMNKLNKLKKLENQTPKIRLYLIWARVASAVYSKVYVDQKAIDRELIQILPEDKNSADFYYVMALIAKLKNDKNDVVKLFSTAIRMDQTFEGFPLVDETFGDKFKKMFSRKASLAGMLILIFCSLSYGQTEAPKTEVPVSQEVPAKPDEKKPEKRKRSKKQREAEEKAQNKTSEKTAQTADSATATPPGAEAAQPVSPAPVVAPEAAAAAAPEAAPLAETAAAESAKPDSLDDEGTDEPTKMDVSENADAQAELYSEDQLPFRYLNQYFIYDVMENGKVVLNEKEYDFSHITAKKEEYSTTFIFKDEMAAHLIKGDVTVLDAEGKELMNEPFEVKDTRYTLRNVENGKVACFAVKSSYSELKICKNIDGTEKAGIKAISANESELGNKGQITVQDSTTRSHLKVQYENGDQFFFETSRRKVYPAVIYKDKDSTLVKVRFVDLDIQTLAWEEVLQIDQRYFEIKMDPLIMLRQDILFPDPDLKSKAISKILIQKQQVTIITKNKFSIAPTIGYSQLIGDNTNLSVKLRTSMGVGLAAQYSKNFRPRWDWYGQFSFLTTKILFEDTTKLLEGRTPSLMNLGGGTIYHWKRNWDLVLGAGVKTDMFLKPINTNQGIEVFTAMNKYLSVAAEWDAYKSRGLEFTLPISFKFNLPGKVDTYTSQLGLQYDLGAKASYRLSWGRVFASMVYGTRQQNYGDFNYKEDYYYMSGGVMYLF